ncbi:MAG: cyclopropane-fatty-acyl-phospholipid synthase family protein [Pseudomonadota bacterium]
MWLLDRFLNKIITQGVLEVEGPDGEAYSYGTPHDDYGPVRLKIADKATASRIARNPALGAGEAFMDGGLTIENDDIFALLGLIAFNMRWDYDNPTRVGLWKSQRILSRIQQVNDSVRSRKNVAHHYDLNDRLYDLFLDADRQYSCAYFIDTGNTLEQAQQDKMAHIAAKLDLKPDHHVLDIGCGWGGLSLYIHKVSGAHVTGITLSEEQLKVARERAAAAGVADRVTFELIDYRHVQESFDRIVSVGMFEHVGRPNFQAYFDSIRDRLKPDGVALVHTIARADGPGVTDPWTQKYIFPGGYAPALSEIIPHVEKAWLWATDIEILRVHYGHTLVYWYKSCEARRAEIEELYDERFYRMWMFYLAAAANAFFHDGHMNAQIQLTRRRDVLPLTRDYIAEVEREYRNKTVS